MFGAPSTVTASAVVRLFTTAAMEDVTAPSTSRATRSGDPPCFTAPWSSAHLQRRYAIHGFGPCPPRSESIQEATSSAEEAEPEEEEEPSEEDAPETYSPIVSMPPTPSPPSSSAQPRRGARMRVRGRGRPSERIAPRSTPSSLSSSSSGFDVIIGPATGTWRRSNHHRTPQTGASSSTLQPPRRSPDASPET